MQDEKVETKIDKKKLYDEATERRRRGEVVTSLEGFHPSKAGYAARLMEIRKAAEGVNNGR